MIGFPYVLIHNHSPDGSKPCGKIAFYLNRKPQAGEVLASKDAMLVDGTHPQAGKVCVCGSCGGNVSARTDDIKEIA
jgi:hypothetical protein